MKIADMTEDEQRALAGLVRWMLQADGRIAPDERVHIDAVAEDLGVERLWALLDEEWPEPLDTDAMRMRARKVLRKPAQETIYCALLDIASAGTIVPAELEVLDWLAELWGLESPNSPYR